MQNVIPFTRSHAQALDSSRAASTINISEVMPADFALSVANIADHRSAGILSRCHHLATAGVRAPTSAAIASLEGHRAITSRKERTSVMPALLGQLVLNGKDNLALDEKLSLGQTVRMTETESEAQFKQAFRERVADARVSANLRQWQIAEALGIPQDKYKQYESRSLLPHHLIGRFCVICRVDPTWLVTGHGEKILKATHLVPTDQSRNVVKPKRIKRVKVA